MALTYLSGGRIEGSSARALGLTHDFNYSSGSGWTQVDGDGSHANITIINGKVEAGSGTNANTTNGVEMGTSYIHYDLGSDLSDTAWIVDFEFKFIDGTNDVHTVPFALTETNAKVVSDATHTSIEFQVYNNNNNTYTARFLCFDNASTRDYSVDYGTALVEGTTYYIRLQRVNATQCKLFVYTDSARTTLLGTVATLTLPSTLNDLQYIQHCSSPSGSTSSPLQIWEIDNTKIYDGSTGAIAEDDKSTLVGSTIPENARFQEIDTRKNYAFYDGAGTTMPSAATGGTITTDGDYKVHTFTSTANFVVTARASQEPMEFLVIAGGAGGSRGRHISSPNGHKKGGGGGGAGGFREIIRTTLPTGTDTYAVEIGNGGGASSNGSASYFAKDTTEEIKANGGGKGGPEDAGWSHTGGGSAGGRGNAKGNKGGFAPPEGFAGQDTGTPTTHQAGGGGGGASEVGNRCNTYDGGKGGKGRSSQISGDVKWYAGGGGGSGQSCESGVSHGAGGFAGGGVGNGGDATVNGTLLETGYGCGGGGGNGSSWGTGGDGGKGVVIIRYRFQNFSRWQEVGVPFIQSYPRDRYPAKYHQNNGVYY